MTVIRFQGCKNLSTERSPNRKIFKRFLGEIYAVLFFLLLQTIVAQANISPQLRLPSQFNMLPSIDVKAMSTLQSALQS